MGLRKDHRPPPFSALPQLVTATKSDIQKNGLVGPMVGHVGDMVFKTLLWIIINIIDGHVNPHNYCVGQNPYLKHQLFIVLAHFNRKLI